MLEVKNLTVQYGDLTIVNDVSFSLKTGQWLMLVGPNGAGKSTIVNAISQGVPYLGSVWFDGGNVKKCKPAQLAKNIGILAQTHSVGYAFSVGEIVRLGRYAYVHGMFAGAEEEDSKKIEYALKITGMKPFEKQAADTLSGGELQRTFLAQLFAQDPNLLILDEPANHLDLVYQKQVFELIKEWVKGTNRAVISVVHDLSLAKAYGTHTLLLDKGNVISTGETKNVLTRDNLKTVYAMDVYQWMGEQLRQWQC
ncbi:ABC transporter ATP-binding protein [Lachnospiraceae bacterium ZAX-1]